MEPNYIELVGYILSLVGVLATVIINSRSSADKITNSLKTNQAVTDEKIENITKELTEMKKDIKEHNNYAQRMPVIEEQLKAISNNNYSDRLNRLESQVNVLSEKVEVSNHRMTDCEKIIEHLRDK